MIFTNLFLRYSHLSLIYTRDLFLLSFHNTELCVLIFKASLSFRSVDSAMYEIRYCKVKLSNGIAANHQSFETILLLRVLLTCHRCVHGN